MSTAAKTSAIPADVRELTAAECWRLLSTHTLGRFAVQFGDGVDIFPVNYLVHDGGIYFRSAPGSKLADLTRHHQVAFEIDGQLAHHVWSVVVHGEATRLGREDEIVKSRVQELAAWHPGDKFNYVRIEPASVSGRNFARR